MLDKFLLTAFEQKLFQRSCEKYFSECRDMILACAKQSVELIIFFVMIGVQGCKGKTLKDTDFIS